MALGEFGCQSRFSTSLRALIPYVTTWTDGTASTAVSTYPMYQYLDYVRSGSRLEEVTVSNKTVVSTGTAYADPIYVAWRAKDLSLFPPAYATSVAKQFDIPFTPTPSPGSSLALPGETNAPSPSTGLSTGAKAGIGLGTVAGIAVILGVGLLFLCLRRRRQIQRVTVGTSGNELPEMVDKNKEPTGT